MNVRPLEPSAEADALLPGAQFCDACSVAIEGAELNARQAAERMLGHGPRCAKSPPEAFTDSKGLTRRD
jgi:hypothetical protein